MHGIAGYVGQQEADKPLLRHLAEPQHRGYDSAGICLRGERGLRPVRALNKLENLQLKGNA